MKTVTSRDGTALAYEELGSGPAIVLVDGAFCGRSFGPMPALAKLLAKQCTVYHYDRRGRGGSGDTPPYALERELEDLAAVFGVAATKAGTAHLYGISSGAALALRGAAHGLPVQRLVVYEPPFALDGVHTPTPPDFREQIAAMIARGERDGAVKLFMKVVGVPAFGIFFMRLLPNVWPKLRAVAHTLPYDFAVLGETQSGLPLPAELASKLESICVPTLALAGGKSPPWLHHAARKVAEGIGGATFAVVPGQDHNVSAQAIAPVLLDYFLTGGSR
jgi:pimeloyl-ACP methyl ester carboxylesterase